MIISRLGFLFLRGNGRRGLVRLALMLAGTSLGVCLLLIALALPAILEGRTQRAAARFPMVAQEETGTWFQKRSHLLGQGPLEELFLANEGNAMLPYGVPAIPAAGEAYVSPALERILGDEHVKAVFPYRIAGLLEPQALVSPDELYAVVAATRADLPAGGAPLAGYGLRGGQLDVDIAQGDLRILQIALLGLVGVPLAVCFAVVARLSAHARDRRLAALRLLGMTQRDTRRVNAVESVLAAFAGALVGLGIYVVLHGHLASLGLGRIVWFPSDSAVTPGMVFLSLVGVPALAAVLAIVGSRSAVNNALDVRRHAPARRAGWLRLVPLGVGLALLLGLLIASARAPGGLRDPAPLMMLVGILLTGLGLALGFVEVAFAVAKLIAARASRPSIILGARRLMFDPSEPARVVAGLVVVIFVVGFLTGLQRDARAATLPLGSFEFYEVQAREVPAEARLELLNLPEIRSAMTSIASHESHPGAGDEEPRLDATGTPDDVGTSQGGELPPLPGITAGFGRCRDLGVLLERPVPECKNGVSYRIRLDEKGASSPRVGQRFHLPFDFSENPRTAIVEVPRAMIVLPYEELAALGGVNVFMPLERLPGGRVPDTARIVLASDTSTRAIQAAVTAIARIAPVAQVGLLNDDVAARRRSEVFQSLLGVALMLGVIVGLLAFIVATLDRAVERRANLVSLSIVGVPLATLRVAQACQVAVPILVGVILALIGGKIAEQVTVSVGGFDHSFQWGSTIVGIALGAGAIVLAVLATLPAVTDRIEAGLIRRE